MKIAGPQTFVKQVATDIFRVIFSLRVELQRNLFPRLLRPLSHQPEDLRAPLFKKVE